MPVRSSKGGDVVLVTCCHCGATFDERLLAGTVLNRRCPACDHALSAADYDARALRPIEKLRMLERKAASLKPVLGQAEVERLAQSVFMRANDQGYWRSEPRRLLAEEGLTADVLAEWVPSPQYGWVERT